MCFYLQDTANGSEINGGVISLAETTRGEDQKNAAGHQ
jgi:hypothetical protein